MGVHGTDTITSKQGFVPWVPGLPLFPISIQQWVRSAPSMSWLSHALWWGHGFNGILAAAQDGCFAGFWGPLWIAKWARLVSRPVIPWIP